MKQSNLTHNGPIFHIYTDTPQTIISMPQQPSKITSFGLGFSQNIANLQSFSIQSFSFNREIGHQMQHQWGCDVENKEMGQEDPLYKVLSLDRGTSQTFTQSQGNKQIAMTYYDQPTIIVSLQSIHQSFQLLQPRSQSLSNSEFFQSSPAEMLFSSLLEPQSSKEAIHEGLHQTQTKFSTKNVTKNMGKLLFKFLWKNRQSLRKKLRIQKSRWDEFICLVKIWKKQNNITRQFLKNRWHGESEDCRLFRIISQHFFRRRFYQAILQSNIQRREILIQRLHRFQKGVRDESALDNLN